VLHIKVNIQTEKFPCNALFNGIRGKLGKKIFTAGAAPSVLKANLKQIPTLRSGLLNAGPSGLRVEMPLSGSHS
jgi:hypothetical protein